MLQSDESVAVEARIAESLLPLTRVREVGGQVLPPAPYVRRHAVEHAAAGGVLDGRYLSAGFLPFVDAARLRPLLAGRAVGTEPSSGLADVWRRAAYAWRWDSPGSNADTLGFWCTASGAAELSGPRVGGMWSTRWAHCHVGRGEILGRHTSGVGAVAVLVLPDGRPIAVTGSYDATVRVWDLSTGTPLGEPLTGHTSSVVAVAALLLPDGRPVAVTGSYDATVRVWDLTTGTPLGEPLTGHTDWVGAVAALLLPDGRPIAVTGSHDATVRVWDLRGLKSLDDPLHVVSGVYALSALTLSNEVRLCIAGDGVTCVTLRYGSLQ